LFWIFDFSFCAATAYDNRVSGSTEFHFRSTAAIALEGGEVMKTHLNCPCGEVIVGVDEDQLVGNAQEHLAEVHPGRDYSADEILIMSW
jgi:hypothetical protein